jgi:hypothetical protein
MTKTKTKPPGGFFGTLILGELFWKSIYYLFVKHDFRGYSLREDCRQLILRGTVVVALISCHYLRFPKEERTRENISIQKDLWQDHESDR